MSRSARVSMRRRDLRRGVSERALRAYCPPGGAGGPGCAVLDGMGSVVGSEGGMWQLVYVQSVTPSRKRRRRWASKTSARTAAPMVR